jgi:hypothetical protein
VRLTIRWPATSLQRSATIVPAPVGVGTVTRMTLDEFRHCALRRNGRAPPPASGVSLQGISKDLGFDAPRWR